MQFPITTNKINNNFQLEKNKINNDFQLKPFTIQ